MKNTSQLIDELRLSYATAATGEKATSVHLFGIRNAAALAGAPVEEIVTRAGLQKSWATEVKKGVKLARHVVAR